MDCKLENLSKILWLSMSESDNKVSSIFKHITWCLFLELSIFFRICLITLSPRHKALSEGPIKSVSYSFNGRDLVEDVKSVHGKKKLEAIKTHPYRIICNIVSGNGTMYKVRWYWSFTNRQFLVFFYSLYTLFVLLRNIQWQLTP